MGWWHDIAGLEARFAKAAEADRGFGCGALIDPAAVIDTSQGPVEIGAGTRICAGATLRGPIRIGPGGLIGNGAFLRGPLLIGAGVSIGYCTELKQALIGDHVAVGPLCFVADSRVDDGAYLGAMVRTSNQRLDRGTVRVSHQGRLVDSGLGKLGCWIGAGASLGIQVIVLPGRVIAPGTLFEPRITISRNLPRGHYRLPQAIERVQPAGEPLKEVLQ